MHRLPLCSSCWLNWQYSTCTSRNHVANSFANRYLKGKIFLKKPSESFFIFSIALSFATWLRAKTDKLVKTCN